LQSRLLRLGRCKLSVDREMLCRLLGKRTLHVNVSQWCKPTRSSRIVSLSRDSSSLLSLSSSSSPRFSLSFFLICASRSSISLVYFDCMADSSSEAFESSLRFSRSVSWTSDRSFLRSS
jgi:hypothetical protein